MLKPLAGKVIVKPMKAEEKTKSGIVLPDSAKEKPNVGEIVASSGVRIENGQKFDSELKAGDIVYYAGYSGTKIETSENKELLIISESDILAKQ